MSAIRHTDPAIYAVAAALYEDTSLTYADIGQRLSLTENDMVNIYQNLRDAGALTFQRRVSSAKPQGVGRSMARLIGQSKEQAELLRHLRKYGWTFEYTGGGHVRCIGPQGQTEIVSSRPGYGAREQFRKHGVTWPGDRPGTKEVEVQAQVVDAAALINDDNSRYIASERQWIAEEKSLVADALAALEQHEPALPETVDGTTPIEPIPMPAAELTLELVARSVDNLAEMFEVLAQEVAAIRQDAGDARREIGVTIAGEDELRTRVEALELRTGALADRIANVDPISSLRAALRRDQPRT